VQVEKPSDITSAEKLIFPGVGSFGQAMEVLQKRDYIKPLLEYIQVNCRGQYAGGFILKSSLGGGPLMACQQA
jgi:imidazoleglycerol phosphate synthase glutamine amidotransferase subunit HisH